MLELDNKIARIELRAEQLVIHLGSMQRNSAEAAAVRGTILQMRQQLRRYKARRQRLARSIEVERAGDGTLPRH
jgi:nitrogen-specific signal transduction histidine kinase